ncbi:MAG: phage tail tape measure protein [Anaerolineae bacterium]|nr:phage tail tape measure protein [Anaerolineae bacterium]
MPGGINLGNAYGSITIDTDQAHTNILGLQKGVGGLSGGLLGLNPVLAATGLALGGAAAAAGGLTAAIGYSINKSADLQEQLSGVKAVTGATNEEVGELRGLIDDLSLDPGLKVTAFEAADAIELLGRNGLKVDQIMAGAAHSTVLLANATGAQFGPAADVATDVMAIFKIKAEDMTQAVDGITSVVNNSKFGFDDFRLALAQGGGVAGAAGVEFEDFTTSIAGIASLFASGADAGTSFKVFLQRLAPTSSTAKKALAELGIITEDGTNRFFDANGQLKSMADISKILNETFADLSEEQRNVALSTIFGTDSMRAAVGLMELGATSADGMTTKFEQLQATMGDTSAAENAATRMDNLNGQIEILKGVFDALTLGIGDKFLPIATNAIQQFTEFIKANSAAIIEFFGYLAEGTVKVQEFAQAMLGVLVNGFNEGGFAGAVSAFWSWITGSDGVLATGPDLMNQVTDLIINLLGSQWPKVANALIYWGDQFWGWIDEVAIPKGLEELNKLGQAIQTWAESEGGSQRLQALGMALVDALIVGMATSVSNTDRLVSILANLATGLVLSLPTILEALLAVGSGIATGVFQGIFTYLTGEEPKEGTVTVFSEVWKGIMQALISTIVPVTSLAFAKGNFEQIWDAFKGMSWSEIGTALVEGIAAGITSGASAIADAALDAAKDALSAATSFLRTGSPSRTTADLIGRPFSEGVAMGITQAAPGVNQAVTASIAAPIDDLAASREAALATATPAAGAGAGGNVTNNSPTFAPVFNISGSDPAAIGDEIERRLERLFDSAQSGSYSYG